MEIICPTFSAAPRMRDRLAASRVAFASEMNALVAAEVAGVAVSRRRVVSAAAPRNSPADSVEKARRRDAGDEGTRRVRGATSGVRAAEADAFTDGGGDGGACGDACADAGADAEAAGGVRGGSCAPSSAPGPAS